MVIVDRGIKGSEEGFNIREGRFKVQAKRNLAEHKSPDFQKNLRSTFQSPDLNFHSPKPLKKPFRA